LLFAIEKAVLFTIPAFTFLGRQFLVCRNDKDEVVLDLLHFFRALTAETPHKYWTKQRFVIQYTHE